MVVHHIVYSVIAALSLVAVYAAGMPAQKKMPSEQQAAEKFEKTPLMEGH